MCACVCRAWVVGKKDVHKNVHAGAYVGLPVQVQDEDSRCASPFLYLSVVVRVSGLVG